MDTKTAHILVDLTGDFYRREAKSFSQTRQNAWAGWTRVLDEVSDVCVPGMNVLDLGCGNLRFERFLAGTDNLNSCDFTAYAIDNCAPLVQHELNAAAVDVHFQDLDILNTLLQRINLADAIEAPPCDLTVAFGFFHHVPGKNNRIRLLQTLIDKTQQGGYVVVSFWQFLNSEKLRTKAEETTAYGCTAAGIDIDALDEGDYLLGWQQDPDVFRYCHHFSEHEIDELANTVAARAREVTRFSADGETDNLNRYLVLQDSSGICADKK